MHAPQIVSDSTASGDYRESELLTLANHIFAGTLVDRQDIISAGIRDERHIACIESLAFTLERGNTQIKSILNLVFDKPADVLSFVKILASEDGVSLEKFKSLQVVRRLATGQISAARLGPILHASSKRLVLAMVASLLENESEVIQIAPMTWAAAVHALMSGLDRKEMIESFLEETGVESVYKLPKWMHVWSQGNREAVKLLESLAGSDDFDIIEGALSIDGLADGMPSYELVGIDVLVRSILTLECPLSIPERMRRLLRLLARILEQASESTDQQVNILELDLVGLSMLRHCVGRKMQIDASNCQIVLVGEVDKIIPQPYFRKLCFGVDLGPGKWRLETIPGLQLGGRPAQLILTPDIINGNAFLWEVTKLVSSTGNVVALRGEGRDGSVNFSIIGPGTSEDFILNPESPEDTLVVEIKWEGVQRQPVAPPVQNSKVLHVMASRESRKTTTFLNFPVQEIDLSAIESVSDLLTSISSADSILVDARIFEDPHHAFEAGLLVGSAKPIQVIVSPGTYSRNELLSDLLGKKLVTLLS